MKKAKQLFLISLLSVIGMCFSVKETYAATTLNCTSTLSSGSKGDQVKVLQTELNKVMNCGLTVDGSFGPATKTCVLSFQKANDLSQDAIVGPKTCQKLNSVYLEAISEKEAEVEDTASDLVCSSSMNLKSGTQVKYLQKKLKAIMGCDLDIDGSYGPATKSCVMDFQTKVGITVDEAVGIKTCNEIKNVYNNRTNSAFLKQGNETTLECHNSLGKGKSGANVKLLQTELNKVAGCSLTVDGSFGSGTLNCVKKFQKEYVAPELITLSKKYANNNAGYVLKALTESNVADGIVGASTCGKLNSEYLKNNNYIISKSVSPIMKTASSSSEKLATATYGMIFKNYGAVGDWYKIKYNNAYAYVKKSDVTTSAVVVDISNQTLKRYQSGKLKMDTVVITGNKSKSWDTPQGAFKVISRTTNIPLMNDSPVNFWIAFKGSSYGFHDANEWRGNGQFYETSPYTYINGGSHGCINMLENDAMVLYANVPTDTPVYVVE